MQRFALAAPRPLHTARLTLRRWEAPDREVFAEMYGDAGVNRWLYSEPATGAALDAAWARRRREPVVTEAGTGLQWAVTRSDTGEVVGEVLLVLTSVEHRGGEVGYVLRPGREGHGYATEAAARVITLGFAAGLHRIVARADARNTASVAVMERLGLRREAWLRENEFVKGEWTDEVVHAVLASEWRARREARAAVKGP